MANQYTRSLSGSVVLHAEHLYTGQHAAHRMASVPPSWVQSVPHLPMFLYPSGMVQLKDSWQLQQTNPANPDVAASWLMVFGSRMFE